MAQHPVEHEVGLQEQMHVPELNANPWLQNCSTTAQVPSTHEKVQAELPFPQVEHAFPLVPQRLASCAPNLMQRFSAQHPFLQVDLLHFLAFCPSGP